MAANGRIGATRWWLRVGEDVFRDDAVDHVRGACVEVSARGGGRRCGVCPWGTSEERRGYRVVVGVIFNDGR